MASCAVPGAVEPVRLGEWLLADGGITSLAPVQVARQKGSDVVIRPNVGGLHWMDFKRGKGLIREGEIATRKSLDQIYGTLPLYKRVLRFTDRFKSRKDEKTDKNQEGISGG